MIFVIEMPIAFTWDLIQVLDWKKSKEADKWEYFPGTTKNTTETNQLTKKPPVVCYLH